MLLLCPPPSLLLVALLAEGVDRNPNLLRSQHDVLESPSSRRAWIEIINAFQPVAYRRRRPPRGGRG